MRQHRYEESSVWEALKETFIVVFQAALVLGTVAVLTWLALNG